MTDTPAPHMTGAEFAQALAAINWRQVEFANRAGVSPVTVSRWISGLQPIPAWAAAHVRLLLAADQFHRAHVAPLPRTRRKAKDQTTEGEKT